MRNYPRHFRATGLYGTVCRFKQENSVIVTNTTDRELELAGQEPRPQLTLVNVRLKLNADGIELCQRIGRLPYGEDLGVVLISGLYCLFFVATCISTVMSIWATKQVH